MHTPPDHDAADFLLSRLLRVRANQGRPYLEFLRRESMSAGLYVLEAGATDAQSPHAQDELYYVVSGRARLSVGEGEQDVQEGALVYVPKHVPHRFHTILERLVLLVVFAPAESGG